MRQGLKTQWIIEGKRLKNGITRKRNIAKAKIRINKKKPRKTHLLFLLKNPLCLYGVTFRYPFIFLVNMIAECFLGIGAKKIKRSMAYKTPIRFVLFAGQWWTIRINFFLHLAVPVLINQNQNKYREQYCCHNFLLDITKIHI